MPVADLAQICPHEAGLIRAVELEQRTVGLEGLPAEPHSLRILNGHQNRGWKAECSTTQPTEKALGSGVGTATKKPDDSHN